MLDDSEEELHQNQTNKFAAFVRGSREVGQRGRKADPNKPEAEPKAAKTPGQQKIKITPSKAKSEPSADDKIDTKVEKDARSKDEMIKEKRMIAFYPRANFGRSIDYFDRRFHGEIMPEVKKIPQDRIKIE